MSYQLPETGYLRVTQIVGDRRAKPPIPAIIPIGKSTWWAGVKKGRFPKPIKLGPIHWVAVHFGANSLGIGDGFGSGFEEGARVDAIVFTADMIRGGETRHVVHALGSFEKVRNIKYSGF